MRSFVHDRTCNTCPRPIASFAALTALAALTASVTLIANIATHCTPSRCLFYRSRRVTVTTTSCTIYCSTPRPTRPIVLTLALRCLHRLR